MTTVEVRGPAKPAAVRLLQVFGVIWLLFGGLPLAIGATVGYEDLARVYLFGFYFVLAGLFALGAGWRRPLGLVTGMVALALMLVTLFGAIFVAIVVFLGVRDRDRVRDFYLAGFGR